MIRCLKSARSRTFLLYTTSLINPHTKKSSGVKSEDLGGQAVGPPLPTQRPGNVSSRNVVIYISPPLSLLPLSLPLSPPLSHTPSPACETKLPVSVEVRRGTVLLEYEFFCT